MLTTPENHKPTWAQIVSDVFSPFVVPIFAAVVALWCTPMHQVAVSSRVSAVFMVAFVSGFIPFAAIVYLIKSGKIHTRSIADRSERFLPMAIAAGCYVVTAIILSSLHAPAWFWLFFAGAAVADLVAMFITRRWKVSAHTTAVGGFAGLLIWISVTGLTVVNPIVMLTIAILISGLVATARMLLGRHDLGQVMAGLGLGVVCACAVMSLSLI